MYAFCLEGGFSGTSIDNPCDVTYDVKQGYSIIKLFANRGNRLSVFVNLCTTRLMSRGVISCFVTCPSIASKMACWKLSAAVFIC